MNWLATLWLAFKRERNRRRRWAYRNRIHFTWGSGPQFRDERDSLAMFKRMHRR